MFVPWKILSWTFPYKKALDVTLTLIALVQPENIVMDIIHSIACILRLDTKYKPNFCDVAWQNEYTSEGTSWWYPVISWCHTRILLPHLICCMIENWFCVPCLLESPAVLQLCYFELMHEYWWSLISSLPAWLMIFSCPWHSSCYIITLGLCLMP